MHFVLFVLIGLVAGALAGRLVSGHGYGMLGDITVGMAGGFLGGWTFTTFAGVAGAEVLFSLLIALMGALALLWAIRLIAPARV